MRNHGIGTAAEQHAVYKHMHGNARSGLNDTLAQEEYEALHTLICGVDHMASGCAWHSERFRKGLTQRQCVSSSWGYLHADALDRTKQCLENHVYVDDEQNGQLIRGYNRNNIQWNAPMDVIGETLPNVTDAWHEEDIITIAHKKIKDRQNCSLIIGIDSSIPEDCNRRLRGNWRYEQDLLICGNLLNSLYHRDARTVTLKKFLYGYTMIDSVKQCYRQQSPDKGIFLPKVTFFRDGSREGFRMVAPWQCDVLLVPGWKGVGINLGND